MLAQLMPTVTFLMRKAPLTAIFLISMMLPAGADDITFQANPIPAPLPAISNPEQQVWRWNAQDAYTDPGGFLLALDQPSSATEQIPANFGIGPVGSNAGTVQASTTATAEISADDTRGSTTGSLSVPLPIGIPRQKPLNSPTPLSPVSAGPVDALGTIGEDGIFHVK